MLELYENIKKEKFRREVQRNITRYMHPEAPPELTTEMLESAIEFVQKPKPYTIVDGVKCRFIHLVHPSFYERLPTEEEVESWLASDEEVSLEGEPSTSTQEADSQASDMVKKKITASEMPDNPAPASDRMCKLQERQDTITKRVKEHFLKPVKTPSVEFEKEPPSVELKRKHSHENPKVDREPSTARVKVCDYSSSTEEDTPRKKKCDKPTKRKKKLNATRRKKERLSDLSGERVEKAECDGPNACGVYYCMHCNSTMNSLITYENHLKGKRHLKNVKMQTSEKASIPLQFGDQNIPVPDNNAEFEPDVSKSDFYCPTCDSHMNCRSMWQSHIHGKRHQKNIRKAPGELPSKAKFVKYNTTSDLETFLEQTNEVIVGMNYIRETHSEGGVTYKCYLCGACCTPYDIISHLTNAKHKFKYLKAIKAFELLKVQSLPLKQIHRNHLIEAAARKYADQYGRGKPEVYGLARREDAETSDVFRGTNENVSSGLCNSKE